MKMLSLFSGVGMIDLAAQWAGIETVAMCEIQPYPQQILKKRFPEAKIYDDIFKLSAEKLKNDGITKVDIISGGFPCQPFSVAGNREGEEDERYLWPEMCRIIRELKPRWILGENVPGLLSIADVSGRRGGTFGSILKDLAQMGYDAIWSVYGANEVGAPHKRERVFILGYAQHNGYASTEIERIPDTAISNKQKRKKQTGQFEGAGISGEFSGLWPTPTVNRNYNRKGCSDTSGNGLATAVGMWPTPKGSLRGDCPSERKRNTPDLSTVVNLWTTPTANDGTNSSMPRSQKERDSVIGAVIREEKLWGTHTASCSVRSKKFQREKLTPMEYAKSLDGQLNPDWVEIMMGLPIGWTDIECDRPQPFPGWPAAMGKSQYDYEPPRVATGIKNRVARLKACGNGCVPQQIYPLFVAIIAAEESNVTLERAEYHG